MNVRSRASSKERSPKHPPAKTAAAASDSAGNIWEPLALAATASDSTEALDRAMAVIGAVYRADRAWIGRYNPAKTHFWGISEWVGSGIVPHLAEMQGVSVEMLGMAHQKFLDGETVVIPDVERLPRQARGLQAELRREGIRSTMAAPLFHQGKPLGFYGIDHVKELAAWTSADLERLPALAQFLAALLHRDLTTLPPTDPPAPPSRSIHVTDTISLRSISLDDVIYIKADGDYSKVHVGDGRNYLERRSLRSWTVQLPRERFLRVHQRYLVDGARISRLDRGSRWTLKLHGISDSIPVGRAFRHTVRMHLGF